MIFKKVLFFIFIISLFQISFASFDIYNSNDLETNYFSFNSPDVFVKTGLNSSNFSVSYTLENNSLAVEIFDLDDCTEGKCGEFNFIDLLSVENDSFSGALVFNITVFNFTDNIFLDIKKPVVDYNYNISRNILSLNVSSSDVDSGVQKVKVYIEEDMELDISDSFFLKDFTLDEGDYSVKIVVFDNADNFIEEEFDIHVNDFVEPTIEIIEVIKEGNALFVKFTSSDDNRVVKYEAIQGNYIVVQNPNSTTINEDFVLPNSESFKILSYDTYGNVKTIEYTYIDYTLRLRNDVGNIEEIVIVSDADLCYIFEINDETINEEFSENTNFFYVIEDNLTGNKRIEGYCVKDKLKKVFELDYFLDKNLPEETILSANNDAEGYIELKWEQSSDAEGDIIYQLYKNDNKIYSGEKLEYIDKNVLYPNEYEYVLKVFDEADNFVVSNKIEIVPSDVKTEIVIEKTAYNVDSNDELKLKFVLEKDSVFEVEIEINGQKANSESFTITQDNFEYNYVPVEGINKLKFKLTDSSGNIEYETVTISYSALIASNVNENEVEVQAGTVDSIKSIEEINSTGADLKSVESDIDYWFYIFILIVIVIIGLVAHNINVYYKDNKNRYHDSDYINKHKTKNKDKKKKLNLPKWSKKDVSFSAYMGDVQKKRIKEENKRILKEKEDRIKKLRGIKEKPKYNSGVHEEKVKDLQQDNRKELFSGVIFGNKNNSKKGNIKNKNIKDEEVQNLENLNVDKKEESQINVKKEKFNNNFMTDDYLDRVRRGWDKTKDYLSKEPKPEEIKAREAAELEKINLARLEKEEQIKKEVNRQEREKHEFKVQERDGIAKKHLEDYLGKKKSKFSFFQKEKELDRELNED